MTIWLILRNVHIFLSCNWVTKGGGTDCSSYFQHLVSENIHCVILWIKDQRLVTYEGFFSLSTIAHYYCIVQQCQRGGTALCLSVHNQRCVSLYICCNKPEGCLFSPPKVSFLIISLSHFRFLLFFPSYFLLPSVALL